MKQWTFQISPMTIPEIDEYCVQDEHWQTFRRTLKGLSTEEKLDYLVEWYKAGIATADTIGVPRRIQVQVDNYLNALIRGGFLNQALQVIR